MTADVTLYRENPPAPPETPSPAAGGRVGPGGLIIVSTTAYAGGAYGTVATGTVTVTWTYARRGHGRGC